MRLVVQQPFNLNGRKEAGTVLSIEDQAELPMLNQIAMVNQKLVREIPDAEAEMILAEQANRRRLAAEAKASIAPSKSGDSGTPVIRNGSETSSTPPKVAGTAPAPAGPPTNPARTPVATAKGEV